MAKSFVVLVGRPNVGKSTLFNRLIGERLSVVDDRPGTTRDRVQATAEWQGLEITIVDTGGLEPLESLRASPKLALAEASIDFVREIRQQVEIAIANADVIIFTVDGQTGLTGADEAVADILRKQIGLRERAGKHVPPVLIAANKTETSAARDSSVEFYSLGFGDVYPISALQGDGTGDLLDAVVKALPKDVPTPLDETIKIAVTGRPNVGKSSLYNELIGEDRVIVSNVPGTTRDAIDTRIDYTEPESSRSANDDADTFSPVIPITLIDTAGIRKRGTIEVGVEKYSVLRALKAIERADVALLLIDAVDGITAQDEHIAGYILDASKSAILVVNKWDMIESADKVDRIAKPVKGLGLLTEKMQLFLQIAQQRFNFMSYAPILFVSAQTGFRCDQIIPTALRVQEARNMRIPTADVNNILRAALEKHPAPTRGSKRLKFYFGTQVGTNPPHFVFNVNDTDLVHFSYKRYLENAIREEFGFLGTPVHLSFRGHRET